MPHILFILPYPTEGASVRLRVEQYVPYLEEAGMTVTLRPFFDRDAFRVMLGRGRTVRKGWSLLMGTRKRFADLRLLDSADLVFVHREAMPVGSPIIERRIARSGVPLVYDFDDAVFLPKEGSLHPWTKRLRNPGKVSEIINLSSLTIAGNGFLAGFARGHTENVEILPTPIDTDRFRPRTEGTGEERHDEGVPVIGWIGNPTGIPYLDMLRPVFQRLAGEVEFVVRVIGGRWECPGVRVESKAWSLRTEVADTQAIDIGIMPLRDTPWARGKCAFKLIQYMSCGKPVVASPVGMNPRVVRDGKQGYLAATEEEWVEKLGRLLRDPQLRETLGGQGRNLVESEYSVRVLAPQFVAALERTLRGQGKPVTLRDSCGEN
jgi:glycosyltransferase involved in cell wall biosynthesis